VADEAAYMRKYIWNNILRGQLLARQGEEPGKALFISSPINPFQTMGKNIKDWYTEFYNEAIRKEKQTQRKARQNELKVALVGYTNSGKTTVMKAMTKANVQGENVLFATLDANVRTLDPSTRPKILLSDTVGFIRNLPHSLVESFKSTLDEVLEADLLLHVVDVSHRNYDAQLKTTMEVLKEIGAGEIPQILIFNKLDLLEGGNQMLPRILKAKQR
jgi:GTP-binding protein HflX